MATLDSDVPLVPAGEGSSSGGATAASSSSKKPKRFEIKKWNAVALWAWDIVVDNCAICRNHIMDLCIECQANQASATSEECTVAWELITSYWTGGFFLVFLPTSVSAIMHFTSIVSADGLGLVKCVHWITASGNSRNMATEGCMLLFQVLYYGRLSSWLINAFIIYQDSMEGIIATTILCKGLFGSGN